MATIPTPGSELRHVRKTITFTGGAGAGAVGNVTLFTITGRVLVVNGTIYCTDGLASSGGTIAVGVQYATVMVDGVTASSIGTDQWIDGVNNAAASGLADTIYLQDPGSNGLAVSADIILAVSLADVTAGTLVVDLWYMPVTDDGALAGDDIDEDLKTNIWSKALSDISSVPAMTASALSGLNWLFALARNKRTQTATTETVYKDDGSTSLATSTKSDDGTTYTRGEYS